MFPGKAEVSTGDQIQTGRSGINPAAFAGPSLPPPNAALGDNMRQRNWEQRETQSYYEMRQAPLPYQYSTQTPHPEYGGGSGNPMTQWLPPAGPATGFAAQRTPTVYGIPGVGNMQRPTYAYNRVVGAGPAPTMYTGTWPGQYYPGGGNTYIPSWEATGLLIKYTRNPSYFRINKYVKEMNVPKDQGYYLTLNGDDPYRVQSVNDYLWADSVDAPGGRQERQGFGFLPYQTARYCFPFSLGKKSVTQAEWPILAEHAAMMAAKSMTVRTILNYNLASTAANWTGGWGTNYGTISGTWSTSSIANSYIQKDLNTALIAVEQASGGIVTDEEALQFTLNPTTTRALSVSPEYKQYITGSPDALAAITDQRNPNRKYGMAPFLYGLRLVVENAIQVTTPKPGNVPTQPATTRSYIWGAATGVISSRPQGIVAAEEQTLDFSTFCFRFLEQMTTEQKSDPDNRREIGRVVEDYCVTLQAPQTGYLFTNIS